jgi:hypothetical protein
MFLWCFVSNIVVFYEKEEAQEKITQETKSRISGSTRRGRWRGRRGIKRRGRERTWSRRKRRYNTAFEEF